MAINFGTALAQGIATGLGQGLQQHYADMRRERLDNRKMEKSFGMFKQQQVYASRVKAVEAQNTTAETWRSEAAKDANTLINEGAMMGAKGLAQEDRPAFIRDYKKTRNGWKKDAILADRGIVLPDYSQFMDDPTLVDAVPKSYMAYGQEPDASMDQVFKYDPRAEENMIQKTAQKLTDKQREKKDTLNGMNEAFLLNSGAKLSDRAQEAIWSIVGPQAYQEAGATRTNPYIGTAQAWVNKGLLVDTGTSFKLKSELTSDDMEALGLPAEAAPVEPTDTPVAPMVTGAVYEDPTKAAYLEEQQQKEQQRTLDTKTEKLGKAIGQEVQSMDALQDLGTELQSVLQDENARAILFGDEYNWRSGLTLSSVLQQLAAKGDVKGAKEARRFLSKMSNISAKIKHEQYGSAQTRDEMARFADQLGDPGILQNPDTLLDQISSRMTLVGDDLKASISGYPQEVRKNFLEINPQLREGVKMALGGTIKAPEEAPQETTAPKETVTDTGDSAYRKQVESYVDSQIKAGVLKESQREEAIKYGMSMSR